MKHKTIILFYGLFICLLLSSAGLISAKNFSEMTGSFIYLPLIFYFASQLLVNRSSKKFQEKPKKILSSIPTRISETIIPEEIIPGVNDQDKRLFLKLIGSAGFSLLLMALFTKKAQAAFFGSVPGPGTVSIKNSAGIKIDPAEEHPTDGYEVAEIDDSSTPSYYGFLKKTGAWYVMKENSSGAYRYAKGSSSFSTNWSNRASLTYDYFDSVFG